MGASFEEVLGSYPFPEREDILAAIDYAAYQYQTDNVVLQATKLPAVLARYLRKRGFDCQSVLDADLDGALACDTRKMGYHPKGTSMRSSWRRSGQSC